MNNHLWEWGTGERPAANSVVDAYLRLGGNSLSIEEISIIEYMVQAFGVDNVLIAISSFCPHSIDSLGKALVYCFGNRDNIDPSLRLFFPPQKEIKYIWDENGYLTFPEDGPEPIDNWNTDEEQLDGISLRKPRIDRIKFEMSTLPSISNELLDDYCLIKHRPFLFSFWEKGFGEPPSDEEKTIIRDSLIQYGYPLVKRAILVLIKEDIKKHQRIPVLLEWLKYASIRDFENLRSVIPNSSHVSNLFIWATPEVEHIELQVSFFERMGRPPSEEEIQKLEELVVLAGETQGFSVPIILEEESQRIDKQSGLEEEPEELRELWGLIEESEGFEELFDLDEGLEGLEESFVLEEEHKGMKQLFDLEEKLKGLEDLLIPEEEPEELLELLSLIEEPEGLEELYVPEEEPEGLYELLDLEKELQRFRKSLVLEEALPGWDKQLVLEDDPERYEEWIALEEETERIQGREESLAQCRSQIISIQYSIKTIPTIPFNIDELKTYHFERTGNYEALIRDFESKVPMVFRCEKCSIYLQEDGIDSRYDSLEDRDECPRCHELLDYHPLESVMHEKVREYLSEIDDLFTRHCIEQFYHGEIAYYCPACGSHFY